jgi:hypothetical protein
MHEIVSQYQGDTPPISCEAPPVAMKAVKGVKAVKDVNAIMRIPCYDSRHTGLSLPRIYKNVEPEYK